MSSIQDEDDVVDAGDDDEEEEEEEEEEGMDLEAEDDDAEKEMDIATLAAQSAPRKRPRKAPTKRTYAGEIRHMFTVLASDDEGDDEQAAIDDDAVSVVDEILTRTLNTIVSTMDVSADPSRSTLREEDLQTALRKPYMFTEQQEDLPNIAKRARQAVI